MPQLGIGIIVTQNPSFVYSISGSKVTTFHMQMPQLGIEIIVTQNPSFGQTGRLEFCFPDYPCAIHRAIYRGQHDPGSGGPLIVTAIRPRDIASKISVPLPKIAARAAQYNAPIYELRRMSFRVPALRIEIVDRQQHTSYRIDLGYPMDLARESTCLKVGRDTGIADWERVLNG